MPVLPFSGPVPSPGVSDGFGPCAPWDPIWSCTELPAGSEAISGDMLQAATEILWARTGMRYDQCVLTIRPCRKSCYGESWPFDGSWWQVGTVYPRPVLFDGNWYNIACGSCPGDCSCSRVEEVILPSPVTQIIEVKVDGAVLPSTAYRLDNWRKLIRIDGNMWPICNDLNKADTEEGTWSVTLMYGEPVPTVGRMAVAELAYQLILACVDPSCCTLPGNVVTQLSRQGVTIDFLDPSDLFRNNRLGLLLSDQFIDMANPNNLRQRSRVFDPDAPSVRIAGS